MIDERIESLLWSELDGSLTEEDRRRLEERLADDGEAVKVREELVLLHEGLAHLPPAQVPRELRPRIREALASRPSPARESFVGSVRAAFGSLSFSQARFAYLVAGLVAGAAISLLVAGGFDTPAGVERGLLYGTANVDHEEWLELDLPAGIGTVRLRREASGLVAFSEGVFDLQIEQATDGSVTVVVSQEGRKRYERRLAPEEIPGS